MLIDILVSRSKTTGIGLGMVSRGQLGSGPDAGSGACSLFSLGVVGGPQLSGTQNKGLPFESLFVVHECCQKAYNHWGEGWFLCFWCGALGEEDAQPMKGCCRVAQSPVFSCLRT
jgi:hypothetical protein